jgi:hypothetical protein
MGQFPRAEDEVEIDQEQMDPSGPTAPRFGLKVAPHSIRGLWSSWLWAGSVDFGKLTGRSGKSFFARFSTVAVRPL